MEWITALSQPWHWSISALAIMLVLFLLTFMGRKFGVSTTFEGICTLAGAGKKDDYFKVNIKDHYWRFAFVLGAAGGGFLAANYLASPEAVAISTQTLDHLSQDWSLPYPEGNGFLPESLYNFTNIKGVILAIIGGFLVGFGARYGRGCTSGHAITGLAHFQLPSLITVIGFFIGGLLMTWVIMPLILA